MACDIELGYFAANGSPQHGGNPDWLTPNLKKANECHYTIRPMTHTVPTKNLKDTVKTIPFKKDIKFENKLMAKVFLHPNTTRGTGSQDDSDESETEVRLETVTKGDLLASILNKTKICFIQINATVMEKETRLILANCSDNHFSISDQGVANCVCKLIGNKELMNCTAKNVDVSIQPILSIRDWEDFDIEMEEDFVKIIC